MNEQRLTQTCTNSTSYRFYGISVEVTAHNSALIDALDSIYTHFAMPLPGDPDLRIDLTGERRYLFAHVRPGLNGSAFDTWSLATPIGSDPMGFMAYRVRAGFGFYEVLKNTYYTILAFALSNLDRFVQVHAGAVAKGQTAIMLPGGSGSGKTTLVVALTRAGYQFLSDEVCLVDPLDFSAVPFPRSVFLREDGVGLFGDLNMGRYRGDIFVMREKKCLVEMEKSAICPLDRSPRVGSIVFPNYVPGATARLQQLSEAEALARLISTGSVLNMSHPGADPGAVLDSVSALVAQAPCFELTTSGLDDALSLIDGFTI